MTFKECTGIIPLTSLRSILVYTTVKEESVLRYFEKKTHKFNLKACDCAFTVTITQLNHISVIMQKYTDEHHHIRSVCFYECVQGVGIYIFTFDVSYCLCTQILCLV